MNCLDLITNSQKEEDRRDRKGRMEGERGRWMEREREEEMAVKQREAQKETWKEEGSERGHFTY